MTQATHIQLQPMEWAIVAALRERGPLATDELLAEVRARGFRTASAATVATRIHTLRRFCVIQRADAGKQGAKAWYRMRMQ